MIGFWTPHKQTCPCATNFSDRQWLQELSSDELYAPWVQQLDAFEGQHYVNGFAHPQVYILTNDPDKPIAKMGWGLLPHWANKNFIQKSTLNAMVETPEKTEHLKREKKIGEDYSM
ncbi:hypothetical protein [Algoriphagus terrigena]|uniref:hypothetical protein n=1 Tax=Algoriphagus terrigena TaxID=344884 RepID=UPI0004145978|nr:hypothetical protein [Algoriphagus terrigena]